MQYPAPKQEYKVMVQCCTYNQSQYIEDALKGFAMQQTNFPFICCVFDDASTDGEQEVLKSWINSHCDLEHVEVYDHPLTMLHMAPDKNNSNCIYAIHLQKVNTWENPEKREMIAYWEKQCEYIAICEGDDYWTDPLKLQKQVNFLDENPEYGLVYTKAKVFNQNNNKLEDYTIGQDANSFDDLIKLNCIGTLTACFRKELYKKYYREITIDPSWKMGDYPIWLFISLNSKIKFLNEITAVYRKQEQSASNYNNIKGQLSFIESISDICSFFLSFANRWDLKNTYKEHILNLIINGYISHDLPIKYSSIVDYWRWKPKFILKYLLSQLTITRKLLR